MRRGIISLDALIAILLLLFLLISVQGFISLNFDNSNSFGIEHEAKANAIKTGSILNAFYATSPSSADYVSINTNLKVFKDETAFITISKSAITSELTASITSRHGPGVPWGWRARSPGSFGPASWSGHRA